MFSVTRALWCMNGQRPAAGSHLRQNRSMAGDPTAYLRGLPPAPAEEIVRQQLGDDEAKADGAGRAEVAIQQPGRMAAGSHGPVVNSWVSASSGSIPHLAAVER